MTAVRWIVEHPGEPPIGGWVEYPDEAAAREHAGGAGTVWALVLPEVVDVLTAAADWWRTENLPEYALDDQEKSLARAVNAYELAQQESK